MTVFSPLHLIRAHEWSHSFFTTYALSLAFFEGVVLDALIRQNVEHTVVLADVAGVRAALAEYGSRCAGRAYEIEPVAVDHGCFHPKLMALTSKTEGHLVVGSNNLTFGGWGTNLECVEHLHPAMAADAFEDAAEFLESLVTAPWVKHRVEQPCMALAAELRRLAVGHPKTGNIRLLHSLDRPILEQIADLAMDLGGAERLTLQFQLITCDSVRHSGVVELVSKVLPLYPTSPFSERALRLPSGPLHFTATVTPAGQFVENPPASNRLSKPERAAHLTRLRHPVINISDPPYA